MLVVQSLYIIGGVLHMLAYKEARAQCSPQERLSAIMHMFLSGEQLEISYGTKDKLEFMHAWVINNGMLCVTNTY